MRKSIYLENTGIKNKIPTKHLTEMFKSHSYKPKAGPTEKVWRKQTNDVFLFYYNRQFQQDQTWSQLYLNVVMLVVNHWTVLLVSSLSKVFFRRFIQNFHELWIYRKMEWNCQMTASCGSGGCYQITPKIEPFVFCDNVNMPWKIHTNPFRTLGILCTYEQT